MTARTAEEGDELYEELKIRIQSFHKQGGILKHQIQLSEHYAPSFAVKIQYTLSQLDVQIMPRKPVIQG